MAGYERNLVLVHTQRLQARSDFESIKALLAERAPDIEVFIVNNMIPNSVTRRQASGRPTYVFSPIPLRRFQPARGKLCTGLPLTKWQEIGRLLAGGVPVPQAIILKPGVRLDPETWGPYTVVKPSRGMQGKGVRLQRTRDVRWEDPLSWPNGDPRHGVDLIAQRFVDTGPNTNHVRVFTVLGRLVYATMTRWSAPRSFALSAAAADPVDEPIAANQGERSLTLCYREEFLAFGERVAAAFPDVAALGIDIIRDHGTGDLYALEVNAGGLTWHLSSDFGRGFQRRRNIDLMRQFGALEVIADALIEVTRREAE